MHVSVMPASSFVAFVTDPLGAGVQGLKTISDIDTVTVSGDVHCGILAVYTPGLTGHGTPKNTTDAFVYGGNTFRSQFAAQLPLV
jgi:hypothetical protein